MGERGGEGGGEEKMGGREGQGGVDEGKEELGEMVGSGGRWEGRWGLDGEDGRGERKTDRKMGKKRAGEQPRSEGWRGGDQSSSMMCEGGTWMRSE